MATFKATVKGSRGEVSRLGGSETGISTSTNGWNVGVNVVGEVDSKGNVLFHIWLTGGSNGSRIKKLKTVSEKMVKRIEKKQSKEPQSNPFAALSAIMSIGELIGGTKDERENNDWKLRMLKAGIPEGGLHMPENWDQLTEQEKTKRLNKVIEVFQEKL